jgi:predicted phage baseplate assembly protein
MALEAPNLDDRTYNDLFAEAKALIPRYAPEWTNHNDSDPGITMLQMFAWMTDILLYRINRVPDKNYIKFLQMLGIELEPGRPASTELTFTLSRDDIDSVIVPKGTQVASAEPDAEGNNIVFETDEALVALGATLAAVQVYDSINYSIQTNANTAANQNFYPFGVYAREGSALLLGFASPIAFTSQQINLTVYIAQEDDAAAMVCELDLEALPLPARLVWEYWDGLQWERLIVDKDETRALTASGHIYLRGPGSKAVKAPMGKVSTPLYWLRTRLDQTFYQNSPNLLTVMINTVRATQAETIRDEVLGGSNGRPNQSFFLSQTPVVALDNPETVTSADGSLITLKNLRLEISERPIIGTDLGFRVWEEVDDFTASGLDDTHFTLNRTTGEVRLGNGDEGRIPVANPSNPSANVIARRYRTGGGANGNVGAGIVTNLQNFVEFVDTVTNKFAAVGGSDEETLDGAQRRAVAMLKTRDRAVTVEDFEYFATSTPGVARALAQPLVHPQFTGAPIPGVVSVIVVPQSSAAAPTPSPGILQAVCQCLTQHRLLTTEVYVVPPTYRTVRVEVDVIARPQHDLAVVKRGVEDALTGYFHPLTGGDDDTGWPFGQTIFFSRVYQTILGVPGVDRIKDNQLVIFLDGVAQPFCRDAPINVGELLTSDTHEVTTSYAR